MLPNSILLKRLGLMSLIVFAVLLALIVSAYLFRAPAATWLGNHFLGKDLTIQCLEFDFGIDPILSVSSLCIESPTINAQITNLSFFIDDWSGKKSHLHINNIAVTHVASEATQQIESEVVELNAFVLPDYLPLITIDKMQLNSYLLSNPVTLHVEQSAANQLSLSGDISATLAIAEGVYSGTINWTPNQILQQSPVLQGYTAPYKHWFDWAELINIPIKSHFELSGQTLNSQHSLSAKNLLKLTECNLNFDVTGNMSIALQLDSKQAVVDLSQLPLHFDLARCSAFENSQKALKLNQINLYLEQPILINQQQTTIPKLAATLPQWQVDPALTLSNIMLGYDQSMLADFKLNISRVLTDLQIDDIELTGLAELSSNGQVSQQGKQLSVVAAQNTLTLNHFSSPWATTNSVSNQFSFKSEIGSADSWQISGQGQQVIKGLKVNGELTLDNLTSQWQISGNSLQDIVLSLTSEGKKLSAANQSLQTLSSQLDIMLTDLNTVSISGQSNIKGILAEHYKFDSLRINHQLTTQLSDLVIIGKHDFSFGMGLVGEANHSDRQFTIKVPYQSVEHIKKLIRQVDPKVQLIDGFFSGSFANTGEKDSYQGAVSISQLSLKYDDYQMLWLEFNEAFKVDSAGLQLNNGKVTVEEINVGLPITGFNAQLSIQNSVAKIDQAKANIVGGAFEIKDYWLDKRQQVANLTITGLDLAKVVALQNQQGIEVTGEMSGNMPIHLFSELPIVDNGLLDSVGPGKLKISNNPAFDSIKAEQKELSLLENVEFKKLSSKVTLTPDGWLDLNFSINGKNPNKKQEVIFNYGHKQNIFTLLKSLRITNSVQDSIEKRLKQIASKKGK